ncbi:carboxymuconolactone decarboxylase family protein [Piscinibacter terrae]|uniref:Alkyl hydroperoxide reductase AhpD n=1 Tax=Piscinibacter terrae TaxID=2496871 RepID=A0A3N7JV68_9BURK|nr:carboxymuconolactone decarboxylase family protein [Albitalea terrae]RQP22805.1 carboxymuconolactone decarboxylase family protein [Albitalea terrae]
MATLDDLRQRIPDWAKDIRLNLDAVITRSSLPSTEAQGAALAAAFATQSQELVQALREGMDPKDAEAALTAAALMGMNNVWYPFVEMAGDEELKTLRAELRMNAYATHGGVSKRQFETCALAASIVGKCHFCVQSHYKLLKEEGLTTQNLRDVGRIAAVVQAAANVLVQVG